MQGAHIVKFFEKLFNLPACKLVRFPDLVHKIFLKSTLSEYTRMPEWLANKIENNGHIHLTLSVYKVGHISSTSVIKLHLKSFSMLMKTVSQTVKSGSLHHTIRVLQLLAVYYLMPKTQWRHIFNAFIDTAKMKSQIQKRKKFTLDSI